MNQIVSKLWAALERFLYFLVVRMAHIHMPEERWQGFLQFVKFGLVGVTNTVVNYIIYVGVLLGLQGLHILPRADYLAATGAGFFISVLWSYYWNDKYVFGRREGEERSLWKSLLKTYASYAFTGLFLNSLLALLWVEVCHWSKLVSPIINLLISVPLNFVLNKFWAFGGKNEK